ncbi:MAG TPA: membrane-bound lytic murein transglycosylase MltF [Parvibaculum sp.]
MFRRNRRMPYLVVGALLVFAFLNLGWYLTYVRPVPQGLAAIKADGRLVILTRLAPTTYYLGTEGRTGVEYLLTQELGKALGVEVEYRTYDTESELIEALKNRKGQIAAAGLVATDTRRAELATVSTYQAARELVVCRRDIPLPKTPKDLAGLKMAVSASTAASEAAFSLSVQTAGLQFVQQDKPVEELLETVADGALDCTVANTLELQVNNPYYPELIEAFPITGDEPLAWLLAPGSQDLGQYVKSWMANMKKSGALAEIERQFFGFLPPFDYVDVRAFQSAMEETLPDYEKAMRDAAGETGLPWQVIAAVAYQESHWKPDARSHTGVRGLMMLTQDTAEHLGVEDRLDPIDSIYAGARYIADLRARIPGGVEEPDRLWFALTAYNMGFAHLLDARALAERLGLDKDRWTDLRRALSLIQKPQYADGLKFGPAKGGQALRFVQQVRAYKHILEARK